MNFLFHSENIVPRTKSSILESVSKQFLCDRLGSISVGIVSKVMNRPCKYVTSVLLKERNNKRSRPFSTLITRPMLDVLADDYVKNLRIQFEGSRTSQVRNNHVTHILYAGDLFRRIFKKDEYHYLDQADKWEQIDENEIRHSFFRQVERKTSRKTSYFDLLSAPCRGQNLPPAATAGLAETKSSVLTIVQNVLNHAYGIGKPKHDRITTLFKISFSEKQKKQEEYKDSILARLVSGSTVRKPALSTPLTKLASPGTFVRYRCLIPCNYRIYGNSDDDPDSTEADSELRIQLTNCPSVMESMALWQRA